MNYVISVVNPLGVNIMHKICEGLTLPIVLSLPCKGTATKNMLDILGLATRSRHLFMTVASEEQTNALIREQRKRLYIDAPGNGITITVPIKSVGGSKTLAFLSNGQNVKGVPNLNYDFELIMVIANQGTTDQVMDAARSAGAQGGTVIHGLGTGSKNAEKFFQVSIAAEKEVILIVSAAEQKGSIMKAIMEQAGPDTKAGAITFSLPITEVAGFGIKEDNNP